MRRESADIGTVAAPSVGGARPRLTGDDRGGAAVQLTALHEYQGRRVSIALTDGSLISDCVLVSARGRVPTLWIFTEDADMFVRRADVAEIWLATRRPRDRAA